MTSKSTITDDCISTEMLKRLIRRSEGGDRYVLAALRELQERRKAAMDSEPVAWLAIYHGEVCDEAIGITRSVVEAQADHFGWESALTEIIPLYRHAQQPVVPDNRAITQHFDTIALETAREIMCDVNRRHEFLGGEVQLLSRIQCRIDDACRSAMLNGGQS